MDILVPFLVLGAVVVVFQLAKASDRVRAIENRLARVKRILRRTVNGNLRGFEDDADSDLLDYEEDLHENEALAQTDNRRICERIPGLDI